MGYYYDECTPATRVRTFIITHEYKSAERHLWMLLTKEHKQTGFSKSYSCKSGVFWIKTMELDVFHVQGRDMCVPDPLEKSHNII